MKPAHFGVVGLIALFTVEPVSALAPPHCASAAAMTVASHSEVAGPLDTPPQKQKVMCFWLSYGRQRFICGDELIDEVKKKCNKIASTEVGEPVECSCTDDPEYIRDSCN